MSAPFMQFYVADYLGDTRHLTTEQHGAYLLLLMTMWRSDGVLPNDPKKLARITGCTASRWARIADDVLAFFDVDDDTLTNKRLKLELEKASEKSNQRAEAGSKGGKAKALKNNKAPVANATDLLCHSSESEPEREEAYASLSRITRPTSTEVARGFLVFWGAYPKRVGKDAAAKSFAKAMARIEDDDPMATIMAGLERALPGWDDPQFIPNPATWLNQGRWADDAPEPRTTHDRSRPANHHQSRAERDEHAALEALARRGTLPRRGPDGPGFDIRPALIEGHVV